jgi:hypothetical protein
MIGAAFLFLTAATGASWAGPFIFSQPFTGNPGDLISVTGVGFGSAPKVYLKPGHKTSATLIPTLTAQDTVAVFELPKGKPFDLYEIWVVNGSASSPHVFVNAPRAMQFDSPEVVSSGTFRVWGRNLYVNNVTPTVTLVDTTTNASLNVTVNFAGPNDAYRLYLTAPSGIVAGHAYQLTVNNGLSTVTSDQTILGHASGTDHYGVLQPWGNEFIYANGPGYKAGVAGTNENDHHVYDVTTDPALTIHAVGDGATDATAAIQQAVNLASSHGGGLVYFPAGTYRLASAAGAGITMQSGVVLQGHSSADTKIVFGPTTPQGASYAFFAFYEPHGTTLSGVADLSLQNVDNTNQVVVNFANDNGPSSKLFLLRLNWDLGTGQSIYEQGDRIVVATSVFNQAANSQNPFSDGATGMGPLSISPATNVWFHNNSITWASGQNYMDNLTNAVFETNHFTRVSDTIVATAAQTSWPFVAGYPITVGQTIERTPGRQMCINFGEYVVVHSNIFDTAGAPLQYNWVDGETINSEGGGPYPRSDSGTVTSASALTIADDSRCYGVCLWNYWPNSTVGLSSGAGVGQLRHITAKNGNTFTIDKAWDVTPSPGDHFTIAEDSLANVLIRYNKMTGNPRGVVLFGDSFLNVSVIANTMTDNGGVFIQPSEGPQFVNGSTFHMSRLRNIEVNGNTLANTKGLYDSHISIIFALVSPTTFWGHSVDGVEIRNNSISGHAGTPVFDVSADGYGAYAFYQDAGASYVDQGVNAMFGTIFQGNSCANCGPNYTLSTGDLATTIWNASSSSSTGVAPTLINDYKFAPTATQASTATVVGND